MRIQKLFPLLGSTTLCLGIAAITSSPAQAFKYTAFTENAIFNVFEECINDGVVIIGEEVKQHTGEWKYAADSVTDGVGGPGYEIHSLAVRETDDSIWVALDANMPITGLFADGADDDNIAWGDLFLNFSGQDFTTAAAAGDLFGIRFAGTNDSPVPQVGLYSQVNPISTTSINNGFSSIDAYNQRAINPDFGDLPANTDYFDRTQSLNAIGSGTYLSSIMYLTEAELAAAGYDANRYAGSQTIAFKFDKNAICESESGYCDKVPEPTSALALLAITAASAFGLHRRRNLEG